MSYSTRGSGGGGFEGFPFRSSHQQGNDNPNQNKRRNKFHNRKKRGGAISCHAKFQVPPIDRKFLIGSNGAVIHSLTTETKCVINVPGKRQLENPNAMVVIQASCIDFLFHGCWEVLNIVFADRADTVNDSTTTPQRLDEMKHLLQSGGLRFDGTKINLNGLFLTGTSGTTEMSVYCITTKNGMDDDSISILVDNEKFIDPSIKAQVIVVSRSGIIESYAKSQVYFGYCPSTLIFIYGSKEDKTNELYEKIKRGIVDLDK